MSKDGDQDGKPKADNNEEAEEECGFCIFMKGGGCKDSFTNWSKCVDEHREGSKDFTEECKDATIALQDCMMEHKDYYKDFIGLADGSDGDKSSEQEKAEDKPKENEKNKSEEAEKDSKENKTEAKSNAGNDAEGKDDETKKSSSEEQGSDDNKDGDKSGSEGKGSDPNTKKRLEDTPADKHNKAAEDSESKQARTHEQETNPVKAKPDHDKKDEAANKPPRPEREENKQQAQEEEEKPDEGSSESKDDEEEEEEEDDKPDIKVQTAPYDRRFVTTNQARHCYTRYQEYHRCAAQEGEDNKDCTFFQKAYRAICPGDWVDNWNEQREAGTFPGRW